MSGPAREGTSGDRGLLSRRALLAGALAAGLVELARRVARGAEGGALLPPAPAGSCLAPGDELEATLVALAETIVPGGADDPSGAPGATDACALTVLLDPELPVVQMAALVGLTLDALARPQGAPFRELDLAAREEIAARAEEQLPQLTLLYRLVRAAFYGGAYNEVGARWMGYPGANLGYVHHPDFTLARPVSEELTGDGSLP